MAGQTYDLGGACVMDVGFAEFIGNFRNGLYMYVYKRPLCTEFHVVFLGEASFFNC